MVRVIKSGIMDMIGAARPSIADPFLPKKIEEGRLDDIRECIGCNICVTGDFSMTPLRCTQNPSMGEEWRRGWHPERISARTGDAHILVVGAGPAGLEAARALGVRGYQVTVADKAREAGGRVARECRLPGLSAWGRVRDWRLLQIGKLANVSLYLESDMTQETIAELGAGHVLVASGSTWRRDGTGSYHTRPIPIAGEILTPDDLMAGKRPAGRHVAIFDDDHYYMGGVLAELCAGAGRQVTLVTPAAFVSDWTRNTLEQGAIHRRLAATGVGIVLNTGLASLHDGGVATVCAYTGTPGRIACDALVMVASRRPEDALFHGLMARTAEWADAGIRSVRLIGDAAAPGPIAWATYAGHRYAREIDTGVWGDDWGDAPSFRREIAELAAD
jgi:dimethylamine/trimethylamine dehydrogenase